MSALCSALTFANNFTVKCRRLIAISVRVCKGGQELGGLHL